MFISIHIPKTAGTALSIIFDYGSGRRILYDYNILRELEYFSGSYQIAYQDDVVDKFNHKDFIKKNFDFIHGHFWYEKYKDIFPNEKYITCLRDPLQRLISYYYHIVDGSDHVLENMAEGLSLYADLQSGKADIVDLATNKQLGNLQSTYLHGRDIKDYDHVFINEKLAESVYQFQLIFDFERNDPFMALDGVDSIPSFNVKSTRKIHRIEVAQHALDEAKKLLSEDYELYRHALEKFQAQSKNI